MKLTSFNGSQLKWRLASKVSSTQQTEENDRDEDTHADADYIAKDNFVPLDGGECPGSNDYFSLSLKLNDTQDEESATEQRSTANFKLY